MRLAAWHWPQITVAILYVFELGYVLANHGKQRPNYNFWLTSGNTAIGIWLMISGGFFR